MQRNRPIIIGAAVLGILAIGLTLMSLFRGPAAPPAPGPAPTPVAVKQLVASRDIAPRTVVTADMVREDTIDAPQPGGLTDRTLVVGKLTGEVVRNGDVFTPAVLVDPIKRAKPANFAVPPGLRAVSVMVDPNSTVGGIVDVGDRVDVVVMHKIRYRNEADQDGETRSGRTIGQNLLVLVTDAALKKAETVPTPAPGPTDPNAPPPAPTPPPPPPAAPAPGTPIPKIRIVLAAPPAVAERLVAAQGLGEIHLTLRDGFGRDQLPVPEAFEYPIRTLGRTTPRRAAGGNGGGNGGSNAGAQAARAVRDVFAPQPQPAAAVMTPPLPPQTMAPAAPAAAAAPATAEVTVIRGTEKSKIEVPQR